MLDQFLSQVFSSWMVLAVLVVVLLALSEFGWRMGLVQSRAEPEKSKDGGSVRTARFTLLGLLLGFSFAMAVRRQHADADQTPDPSSTDRLATAKMPL
jgi:cytochrome c-type biogenesis protein CcmH/NrfG